MRGVGFCSPITIAPLFTHSIETLATTLLATTLLATISYRFQHPMNVFNQLIANILPVVPKGIVRQVSSKYIAGATLEDGMRVVRSLNERGAAATVDVLGEFITSIAQAKENTRYSCEVIRRLHRDKLDGNHSIKLTSLGLGLDNIEFEKNIREILVTARENGNMFVRFDMENSPYTTMTIDLYRKLRPDFPQIGLVLQAYMRRIECDIDQLLAEAAISGQRLNVRLCKGIYVESADIAFKDRKEIQDNYLLVLEKLFHGGAYVGIATHDDVLITGAKRLIEKFKLERNQFEFQMLLGVREEVHRHGWQSRHRPRHGTAFPKRADSYPESLSYP